MQQVAPAPNRPICHEVQQQVASVCVTGTRSPGHSSGCTPWEDLDAYAFPPVAILGKLMENLQDSPCKRIMLIAPGWPNMPWLWDLVAMSSQVPLSLPNLLTQPFNQIPHRNLTNLNLHAWLLEPQQSRSRADQSMRQSGIPSWNLSLVLHRLTKALFEPIKEASLKHLTFKTLFLLALGSGKHRSEIHAWQNKNIRHQSKVSLYPSPGFLSKNHLAKEGPDSVVPVVIPALAPTLDRPLKYDRSHCLVRALHYYLDRTSDLRQNKELVFVSFKKGCDKDIWPATISWWIRQTVILCYEISDQEAHTLRQVKAHDVRAFAASKVFQLGVSWEQILSACHWKSHNTFTQFYLKDVARADSELYHLGPAVAAQQIHQ